MTVSLGRVEGDVNEQQIMENYWANQGYTFFHESYHYGGTVSQPRAADWCYKPEDCWDMALNTRRGTGKYHLIQQLVSLPLMHCDLLNGVKETMLIHNHTRMGN
jgi:hypothetical protein